LRQLKEASDTDPAASKSRQLVSVGGGDETVSRVRIEGLQLCGSAKDGLAIVGSRDVVVSRRLHRPAANGPSPQPEAAIIHAVLIVLEVSVHGGTQDDRRREQDSGKRRMPSGA
jgi:hypothetical protein